jgi:hypothetical protein
VAFSINTAVCSAVISIPVSPVTWTMKSFNLLQGDLALLMNETQLAAPA